MSSPRCSIAVREFGRTPDGQLVHEYRLTNPNNLSVSFLTRGVTITDVQTPDRHNHTASVTLGFTDLNDWLAHGHNFNSIVGRYANRIANAKFAIHGKEYQLNSNNGTNHLHGGPTGFYTRVFAETGRTVTDDEASVTLRYVSEDGEEGYPGELTVECTMTLTANNALTMIFAATTTATTIVNICNHAYWNLSGNYSDSIEGHWLQLNAEQYTPINDVMIPTGELASVKDEAHSHHDFTVAKPINRDIGRFASVDKPANGGYDHNYVVSEHSDKTHPSLKHGEVYAATLRDPHTGRTMDVYTTAPGIQIYTGNFLDGSVRGKEGKPYAKHAGVCMETQTYPNSPNEPAFPSPVLEPGQRYKHVVTHVFTIDPSVHA